MFCKKSKDVSGDEGARAIGKNLLEDRNKTRLRERERERERGGGEERVTVAILAFICLGLPA